MATPAACPVALQSAEFTGAGGKPIALPSYRAAAPDPLWREAPGILRHLSRGHMSELIACVRAHGMHRAEWVTPAALDRFGLRLLVFTADGVADTRLAFPGGPVRSFSQVPHSLRAVLACGCQPPGPSPGDNDHGSSPAMSSLQARLAQLSAPEPFVRWARPFTDFQSCWDACPDATWMLWAAARLAATSQQRRAIVCCTAATGELALGNHKHTDPRITAAFAAARMWARGTTGQATVATAGRDALDAATEAAGRAAREASQARTLFSLAPRRRLASVTTSRAIAAHLASRAATRQEAAAYAAAWTARSAEARHHHGPAPAVGSIRQPRRHLRHHRPIPSARTRQPASSSPRRCPLRQDRAALPAMPATRLTSSCRSRVKVL